MKQLKYLFGLFSLSFLLLSVSNCGSSHNDKTKKLVNNPPFVISEIYSQDWVAGVQGGGSGTNLHINLETIDEGVELQQVFFRRKTEKLTQAGDNPKKCTGFFKNEMNQDVIMDGDPLKESQNKPREPYPFELAKNEAVISYTLNGATGYFKVSDIAEKPMIAYPASNPNGID